MCTGFQISENMDASKAINPVTKDPISMGIILFFIYSIFSSNVAFQRARLFVLRCKSLVNHFRLYLQVL